ncbi:MAG: DNA polymerase III subunit alpha [Spirochaetes bacterium]|nr:DNA polymerase III subunit alpha [Spirochaetota bacterium]
MNFVFIENHSVYSLCEGTIFISELASYAEKNNFTYLSICDTNGFYGIMHFIDACKEHNLIPVVCAGIKSKSFNGILVARSMRGYSRICNYITQVHLNPDFNLKEQLAKNSDDYYIITGDRDIIETKNSNVYAEVNALADNHFEDYRYAKKNGIKPVLIYPVYFINGGYDSHKMLRAVYYNKKLSALGKNDVQQPDACFIPEEEIISRFSHMQDAVANSVKIAETSAFEFTAGAPIFPVYSDDSFNILRNMCYENIPARYEKLTPEITTRLEKELGIIKSKGFADYFLVVQDIVKQTIYTCGRGSAAASLVSYLLFITHVDPIKHNLFFERFINEGRKDPPDIDIDFPWDVRDGIIDYIFRRYSPDNVAMVSNHITFSVRSSVREIAKVHGLPEQDINRITKNIGFYYNRNSDDYENYSKNKYSNGGEGGDSDGWMDIYRQAVDISGMVRYMSVHCGGVVITPKPVRYYIPVEEAAKGVNIIQLEKDQAEDFGFVKIDVLGNRSLAVVRDALQLIKEHYGTDIRYENFNPINDKKTINMLAAGESMGVFYVESPAMRQLQKKSGKGDYDHLVMHSSIIRPAANKWINEYLERLRGKPYKGLVPGMEELLKDSYGIMCYQEDITKIAMYIAGFSLSEGEELRKVISKRSKQKRKLQLKEKLYENLKKKGIHLKIIDELWEMIESFSGYSFCKPHSASYALLSFKACYLKAHYPAEFMGAVLKNQGGFYSPLAYISESRRMGLKIAAPDINMSRYEYFGKRDSVFIGFMQIKNLSYKAVQSFIGERERNGLYRNLNDFLRRSEVGQSDAEILVKAGCFSGIEKHNQPQLLFIIRRFFDGSQPAAGKELFHGALYPDIVPPPMRDIPDEQKLMQEMELYDSFISIHPMTFYRQRIKTGVIFAKDLERFKKKRVRIAGIFITSKTVMTKDNDLMKFVSFEDETGIFETVFFPKIYRKFALMLSYQRPYIISGIVDVEFDTIILNVNDIAIA